MTWFQIYKYPCDVPQLTVLELCCKVFTYLQVKREKNFQPLVKFLIIWKIYEKIKKFVAKEKHSSYLKCGLIL